MTKIYGVGACAGIGIGTVFLLRREELEVRRYSADYEVEKKRYRQAVRQFCSEVEQAAKAVEGRLGNGEASILRAQILMVQDPALEEPLLEHLRREQINAEYAFAKICDGLIGLFASMEDALLSARAADFRDIRGRMLGILMGKSPVDLGELPVGTVVVARELEPSQSAFLDPGRIRGIATEEGTRHTHIAILARSLGIPAVVGAKGLLAATVHGQEILVEGDLGCVVLSPGPEERESACRRTKGRSVHGMPTVCRVLPAATKDGAPVEVSANLGMARELPALLESGADGIGLFRTEYLFMERKTLPGEEEQYLQYAATARAMEGRPVVIRTLDTGGDKGIPGLTVAEEENPSLGLRAIRFCLAHPGLLKTQLRALLRAGTQGNLQVLVPMITGVEELLQVRALLEQAAAELDCKRIPCAKTLPLGVMIETPAAALCAGELARHADFFSIGTNDLTQYTLAVDRGNRHVAHLYSALHPAVLRLLFHTAREAASAGIPVGICGEEAADPLLLPFLVGAGIKKLSVNASSVPQVKDQVRALKMEDCRQWAEQAVALATQSQVEELLRAALDPPH